ncbi:MAG: hypothetical protein ACXW1S_08655 [Acidimicrobiia bacterium]
MTTTPPTAPPFRAPSSRGQTLDLDSFAGKVPIVLFRSGPLSEGSLALVTELDRREVEFGHQFAEWLLRAVAELGLTDDPAPTDPNDADDVTPLGPQLDHGS